MVADSDALEEKTSALVAESVIVAVSAALETNVCEVVALSVTVEASAASAFQIIPPTCANETAANAASPSTLHLTRLRDRPHGTNALVPHRLHQSM